MVTETDINESLKTLAQDAENARLYGSPPDAIVMRAIELGKGTRAELRVATGFGYDVIEKCLERTAGDLRSEFEGTIERFMLANAPEIVKGICIDCGGPRSERSWERCRGCHVAKIHNEQRAASVQTTRGDALKKIDEMIARGKEPPETTSNGGSVIHESVKSGYEVVPAPAVEHCFCGREQPPGGKHRGTHRNQAARRPGVTHGAPPVPLDYDKIENLRAEGMTIEGISLKLGHAKSTLNNRRGSDKRLNDALNNGLGRYSRDPLSRETQNGTAPKPMTDRELESKVANTEKIIPEIIPSEQPAETVESDKKMDTLPVKFTPQQMIDRFNGFDDGEIDEFFSKMNETAGVDNVVWGVLPEEPKHSKQFFSVAYNVLVTMLDDGMSADQKHSVWTLICYMKRLQKDGFGG